MGRFKKKKSVYGSDYIGYYDSKKNSDEDVGCISKKTKNYTSGGEYKEIFAKDIISPKGYIDVEEYGNKTVQEIRAAGGEYFGRIEEKDKEDCVFGENPVKYYDEYGNYTFKNPLDKFWESVAKEEKAYSSDYGEPSGGSSFSSFNFSSITEEDIKRKGGAVGGIFISILILITAFEEPWILIPTLIFSAFILLLYLIYRGGVELSHLSNRLERWGDRQSKLVRVVLGLIIAVVVYGGWYLWATQ